MKKLISQVLVFLILISGSISAQAASELTGMSVISTLKETKKLVLNTSDVKSKVVYCEILSENGTFIHKQEINNQIVSTTLFNLEKLEQGNYVIVLEDDRVFQEFFIEINEDNLEILSDYKITYKPYINVHQKRFLDINLMARGKEARLKITDDEGEIYKESLAASPAINKRYNLDKLPRGIYTVELSINGKYFYKEIKV